MAEFSEDESTSDSDVLSYDEYRWWSGSSYDSSCMSGSESDMDGDTDATLESNHSEGIWQMTKCMYYQNLTLLRSEPVSVDHFP